MARSYWRTLLAIFITVEYTLAEIEIETAKITCTHDGFLPHPDNCQAFYWCSLRRSSRAIILECDDPQIFDTKTQNCLPPSQSTRRECGGTFGLANEVEDQIAEEDHYNFQRQLNGVECTQEGFMGDEEDCTKFYRCIPNGRGLFQKYGFECGTGTIWDREINSCNHPWATRDARCGTYGSNFNPDTSNLNNPNINYYPDSNYEQQNNFQQPENNYNNNIQQPPSNYYDQNNPNNVQNPTPQIPDNVNNIQQPDNNYNNIQQPPSNYYDQNNPNNVQNPPQIPDNVNNIQQPGNNYNNIQQPPSNYYEQNNPNNIQQPLPQIPDDNNVQQPDYNQNNNEQPENNPSDVVCLQDGFVGDVRDCQKFYRCVPNGRGSFLKYEFSCGQGTIWDSDLQSCNHIWATRNSNCIGDNNNNIPNSEHDPNNPNYPENTENSQPIPENITNHKPSENNPYIPENQYPENPQPISPKPETQYPENQPSDTQKPPENYPPNPEQNSTESPENYPEPNYETPESKCTEESFIPDPKNCKKFFRCVKNSRGFSKYEFTCGDGTVWDRDLQTCNHPENTRKPCGTNSEIVQPLTTTAPESTANESNTNSENSTTINPELSSTVDIPENTIESTTSDSSISTSTTENTTSSDSMISSNTTTSNNELSNISSTTPISETSSTIPESTTEIVPQYDACTRDGFIGDSKNCKTFYRCVSNNQKTFIKYEFTCGEGTIWDGEQNTCNYPHSTRRQCSTTEEISNTEPENISTTVSSTDNKTQSSSTTISGISNTSTSSSTDENTGTQEQTTEGLTTVESTEISIENTENIATEISNINTVDLGESTTTIVPSSENISSTALPQQTTKVLNTETNTELIYSTTITNTEIGTTTLSENTATTTQSSQSQTSTTTQKPIENNLLSSETCNQEGFFPNLQNCNKFYRCVSNGKTYTKYDFSCGPGTIWDPNLDTCNHPYAVKNKKCRQELHSGTQIPESGKEESTTENGRPANGTISSTTSERPETELNAEICTAEGFYPNRRDCKKFFRCVESPNGYTKYDFTCGDGTIFDPDLQICNHPYATQNRACGHSPEKESQSSTTSTELTTVAETTTIGETTTITTEQQTTEDTITTVSNTETATQNLNELTTEQTTNIIDMTTEINQQQTTTNIDNLTETTTDTQSTDVTTELTTEVEKEISTTQNLTTIDMTTEINQQETTTNIDNLNETTTHLTTEVEKDIPTTQNIQETTTPDISETTTQETQLTTLIDTTTQPEITTIEGTTSEATTLTTEIVDTFTETTLDNRETTTELTTELTTDLTTDLTTERLTETSTNTETLDTTTIFNPTTTELNEIASTTSSNLNQSLPCPISELEGDQISLICPTGFKRHPKYCNLFYQCTNNPDSTEIKILVLSCPDGTIYDDSKIQCLSPTQTSQKCIGEIKEKLQLKKIGQNNIIPMEINSQKPLCPKEGTYPLDQSKCLNNYLQCHLSSRKTMRAYMQQCQSGYTYWPISKRCEKQSPILGCEDDPTDLSKWMIPVLVKSESNRNI